MLTVQSINKSIKKKQILKDISFELKDGECLGLIGPNGAGKSTLMNIIGGIAPTSDGNVWFDGVEFSETDAAIRKKVGLQSDDSILIDHLSGIDFLKLHGALLDIPKENLKQRIEELTHYFLQDQAQLKQLISSYSLGMKRRLELCTALLNQPEYILLDEPFNGLDPFACQFVMDTVQQMKHTQKKIIVSSHDLSYVKNIATHILLLQNGEIVFWGTSEEFFKSEQDVLSNFFNYLSTENQEQNKTTPSWL